MIVLSIRRRLRPVLLGAALALTATVALGPLATVATAQFGSQSGFADAFMPEFLPRDMALFNEHLGLEDWQRPIVQMLLEDYGTNFGAGTEAVRDQMREVSSRLDGRSSAEVMDLVMGPVQTWLADRRQLGESFLSNVRSQLSERQREQWPAFERALRRDKQLPRGELSGESVNLVVILREMPLDAETRNAIRPAVDQYTIQLDDALVARENVIRSLEGRVGEAMRNMDFAAGIAATEQIMSARIGVRGAQDRAAAEIEAALPTSYRAEFRQRHRELAYPKVYRAGSQMDRFFESVRAITDLQPEQIASIDQIEIGYYEQIDAINDQMMDAVRTEEPVEARRRTEAMRARQEGTPVAPREQPRSAQLMVERDGVGEQARQAILALLTAEQLTQLPSNAKARLSSPDMPADRRGLVQPIGAAPPVQRGDDPQREQRERDAGLRDPERGIGSAGPRDGQRGGGDQRRGE